MALHGGTFSRHGLGSVLHDQRSQGHKGAPVKGEGMTFYSPDEVIIAYNEGKLGLHASQMRTR